MYRQGQGARRRRGGSAWVTEQLDEVFATGRPLEGDIASFAGSHDELAAFQEMREDLVTSLVGEIKSSSGAAEVYFLLIGSMDQRHST